MVSIDTFKSSFSLSNFSFSIHLTAPELEPPGSPFLPFPAVCTLAGCKRLVQGRKMGRSRPAGLAVVLYGASCSWREGEVGGSKLENQLDDKGGVEGHRCPRSCSQNTPRTSPDTLDCQPMWLAKLEVAAASPSMRTGGRSSIVTSISHSSRITKTSLSIIDLQY